MTITFQNLPVQPTTANAAIAILDESNMLEGRSDSTYKNGVRAHWTEYTLLGVDPSTETFAVVRHEYDEKADETRFSIRLRTNVEDDTLDDILVGSYEAVVAMNFPGKYGVDVTQMSVLMQCCYGLFAADYDGSTGVPDNDPLNRLNRGSVSEIWT
jgi:hypothetical protein